MQGTSMDLNAARVAGLRPRGGSNPVSRLSPLVILLIALGPSLAAAQPSMQRTVRDAQERVVKIYGAGGLAGLEAYQSGFLVSPEGHVATAWSYVLDVDPIVVLDDGRRFESTIVGFEPSLELAVLKIEASGVPFFRFSAETKPQWG